MTNVLPLVDQDDANWLNCPVCHTDESADMDPVFLKLYIPSQPPREFEWATGPACAAEIRSRIYEHCEDLPDRQVEVGGLAPKPPDAGPWAALGLRMP